ncbi:MAG TPA: response regulator [Tepidisphaeraceae bacterium]|nr:response regulator [Tepidisphaeraceae bacterium]
MSLIAESKSPVISASPTVLVVEDETDIRDLIATALQRDLNCRVRAVPSLRQARRILATEPVELLVADIGLPDGDGMSLLKALRSRHPYSQAIIITGKPSMEDAVTAMRYGAADLLAKPFTAETLIEHARRAIRRQQLAAKDEVRIEKLKTAVRRLNESRRMVARKVDLLCNDLVGAYGELAKQLDQVRTQEGFRSLLAAAKDLEQLLCHAMDWMLRQHGYCNIAVWLAGQDQFQLGAYMKHTIAGDPPLIEAMRQGMLRRVIREGFVHLEGEEAAGALTAAENRFLRGQTIVGTHCTYLGESLAVLILYREGARPFTAADAEVIKSIGPIFAVALAAAVRVEGGEHDESDGGLAEPDDGADMPEKPRKRKKTSDADWWKNGEPPPF